jgi:hypothetical protein
MKVLKTSPARNSFIESEILQIETSSRPGTLEDVKEYIQEKSEINITFENNGEFGWFENKTKDTLALFHSDGVIVYSILPGYLKHIL